MDIEKLRKEDFCSSHIPRSVPSIRFTKNGLIILSRSAVVHLGLKYGKSLHGVSILHDKKDHCEFFIMRDDGGWRLRHISFGQAAFNNSVLAHYIVCKTFEKCAHAADAVMCESYSFRIALLPVDDDKNSGVYALLRKKNYL